jgi:pantetheine-phosphate adenylyltransferase
MTTGIYPGTFDPITKGHLDIIHRSMKFCDKLVIAIGINPAKTTMFTEEERAAQIRKSISPGMELVSSTFLSVVSFQGLLVEYAKEIKANVLIRGIRSVSDFEYEINLANINKILAPTIETVFLPTSPDLAVVSSSMVKEVAKLGGDISQFVPSNVEEAIQKKFGFHKTVNIIQGRGI